jgi:hypothetical protein
MLATGKLPPDAIPGDLASQECILGMEVSGTEHATGRRLMGLLSAKVRLITNMGTFTNTMDLNVLR